jgi:hypothetical protein
VGGALPWRLDTGCRGHWSYQCTGFVTLCTVAMLWGQTVMKFLLTFAWLHVAGCSAGPAEAAVQLPGQDAAAPLAVQRAAYARALGLPALLDLMSRVDTAHQQVLLPAACSRLLMRFLVDC